MKTSKFFIISLTAFFLLINNLKGQYDTTKWLDNNQIKFSLVTAVVENIDIANYSLNCQLLNSYPMPGIEASTSYYLHLNKGWGLNFGIGGGIAFYNLHYEITLPDDAYSPYADSTSTATTKFNKSDITQKYLTIPISIQKSFRFSNSKNIFHILEAGARVNFLFKNHTKIVETYPISATENATLFTADLRNPNKIKGSVYFKYGIQEILKNQNTFQCNIVLHYSPAEPTFGSYQFTQIDNSYTTSSQKINYIGLEFIYGLTLSKNK